MNEHEPIKGEVLPEDAPDPFTDPAGFAAWVKMQRRMHVFNDWRDLLRERCFDGLVGAEFTMVIIDDVVQSMDFGEAEKRAMAQLLGPRSLRAEELRSVLKRPYEPEPVDFGRDCGPREQKRVQPHTHLIPETPLSARAQKRFATKHRGGIGRGRK